MDMPIAATREPEAVDRETPLQHLHRRVDRKGGRPAALPRDQQPAIREVLTPKLRDLETPKPFIRRQRDVGTGLSARVSEDIVDGFGGGGTCDAVRLGNCRDDRGRVVRTEALLDEPFVP